MSDPGDRKRVVQDPISASQEPASAPRGGQAAAPRSGAEEEASALRSGRGRGRGLWQTWARNSLLATNGSDLRNVILPYLRQGAASRVKDDEFEQTWLKLITDVPRENDTPIDRVGRPVEPGDELPKSNMLGNISVYVARLPTFLHQFVAVASLLPRLWYDVESGSTMKTMTDPSFMPKSGVNLLTWRYHRSAILGNLRSILRVLFLDQNEQTDDDKTFMAFLVDQWFPALAAVPSSSSLLHQALSYLATQVDRPDAPLSLVAVRQRKTPYAFFPSYAEVPGAMKPMDTSPNTYLVPVTLRVESKEVLPGIVMAALDVTERPIWPWLAAKAVQTVQAARSREDVVLALNFRPELPAPAFAAVMSLVATPPVVGAALVGALAAAAKKQGLDETKTNDMIVDALTVEVLRRNAADAVQQGDEQKLADIVPHMAANVQQLEETLRQPLPVPERKEETHGPSPPVAEGKRRVPQGGGEEPAVPPVPAAPATLPTQIVQLIEDVRVVVEEASHIGSTAMTPNQKRQRKHAAQLLASVLDTLPDQIAFRRACEAKLPLLLEAIVTLDNSLVVARIFMKRIWAATKRPAPRRRVEDPPSTEMDEEEEARKRDEDEEDEQQELVDVFSRQWTSDQRIGKGTWEARTNSPDEILFKQAGYTLVQHWSRLSQDWKRRHVDDDAVDFLNEWSDSRDEVRWATAARHVLQWIVRHAKRRNEIGAVLDREYGLLFGPHAIAFVQEDDYLAEFSLPYTIVLHLMAERQGFGTYDDATMSFKMHAKVNWTDIRTTTLMNFVCSRSHLWPAAPASLFACSNAESIRAPLDLFAKRPVRVAWGIEEDSIENFYAVQTLQQLLTDDETFSSFVFLHEPYLVDRPRTDPVIASANAKMERVRIHADVLVLLSDAPLEETSLEWIVDQAQPYEESKTVILSLRIGAEASGGARPSLQDEAVRLGIHGMAVDNHQDASLREVFAGNMAPYLEQRLKTDFRDKVSYVRVLTEDRHTRKVERLLTRAFQELKRNLGDTWTALSRRGDGVAQFVVIVQHRDEYATDKELRDAFKESVAQAKAEAKTDIGPVNIYTLLDTDEALLPKERHDWFTFAMQVAKELGVYFDCQIASNQDVSSKERELSSALIRRANFNWVGTA